MKNKNHTCLSKKKNTAFLFVWKIYLKAMCDGFI